jgi:SAM-dependent methyltransferase
LPYLIKYHRDPGKPLTTVCPAGSSAAAEIARTLETSGYVVTGIEPFGNSIGDAVLPVALDRQHRAKPLWRRITDTYRRGGLVVLLAKAFRKIGGRALYRIQYVFDGRFDRRYGIDTQGSVSLLDLPFQSPNKNDGIEYQPTSKRTFCKMMSHLPRSLAGFDFVDIGCGKGRVLFYAADWNFDRIVGIDFSPELTEIARRNIAAFVRATGDERIDVRYEDATQMVLPAEPCVFFFASPFMDVVLMEVAARIEASYRANPRKIYVVYYGTQSIPDIVSRFGFLKLSAEGYDCLDFIAPRVDPYAVFESVL